MLVSLFRYKLYVFDGIKEPSKLLILLLEKSAKTSKKNYKILFILIITTFL